MNALDYFLKANLYGLLFVGCYWLFLRRHTFFNVNRAYLLISAVLSLVLPVASLPTQTVQTLPDPVPVGVISLPVATISTVTAEMGQSGSGPDWEQIGLLIYGLMAVLFLLWVIVRVGRLVMLIRRSPRQMGDGYLLVQPNNPNIPTFSFFGYLVLNPADVDNDLIIKHELVHIRQYHSADVVGMALLRAVFWACPALWLIDRMLRQVHEFLADEPASQPTDYARFLVEYTFGVRPDTLTNGFFNPSLLKQRIQMLRQRATTRWALGKYVLVIPLAFILLAMTTSREEIVNIIQPTAAETITVSGRVTSATGREPISGVTATSTGNNIQPAIREETANVVSQAMNEAFTISGRVTNVADGKPLSGAVLVVKNTKQGTTTDADGRYELSNVPEGALLVVSFVGFIPQELKVDNQRVINVAMALQTSKLNEVVVVAYEPAVEPVPVAESIPAKPNSQTGINNEVFTVVEQQPEFTGGMRAMSQYLSRNLRYPKEARQGKVQGQVLVQFVVAQTGEIQNLRVLKGIGGGCDEEAVRVVSQMPNWNPGKQNGKAVSVQYNLPIQFSLEKREDKRTGQADPSLIKLTDSTIGDSPTTRPIQSGFKTANVTIRGTGPLGELGAEPLYIIDSVQTTSETFKSLNPNTIESITVLKNSSAAAYGEKGKNGVVLITTKKK